VIEECQLELTESSEAEKDTDICLALVRALNRKGIQSEKKPVPVVPFFEHLEEEGIS